MKRKQVMFAIILILLIGIFYIIQSEKINVVLTPFKTDSIEEINKNPKIFENKTMRVSGIFYRIIGWEIYDINHNKTADINYKIVDLQGFELLINAPNRELDYYTGKEVTASGTIKIGYKYYFIAREYELQHYLELSKISQ